MTQGSGDANKQIVYAFIVKIMKYPIYMSLSCNSSDFQCKADFGIVVTSNTLVLVLFASREHVHDMLLVSVLVSEVELKLSNIFQHGPT
jgi:hypothetical protein